MRFNNWSSKNLGRTQGRRSASGEGTPGILGRDQCKNNMYCGPGKAGTERKSIAGSPGVMGPVFAQAGLLAAVDTPLAEVAGPIPGH
jgi:hypothetical protein